jgi:hypothetical protein
MANRRRGQSSQRRDLRSARSKDHDDDLTAYRQFPKMVGYQRRGRLSHGLHAFVDFDRKISNLVRAGGKLA